MRFLSAKTIDLVSCYWGESIYAMLGVFKLRKQVLRNYAKAL
jgi:hypothetical protein